ncbi:MAG TPA: xanthine dehydrogenase family protein molybdopterin-binding subunit [Halanaerobiales bacterium]|nr:xanthine dehydrogenase family protein molybdopterin-binding subunit [Halanaerobiales bacterium]
MSEEMIGKSVNRIKALEKVTGSATFVHDMELQGMLHAKMKLSPHAHAKIVNIDSSEAEKLPGVWTVLTGKDLPYKVGLYLVDKDILAVDKVRYQGEPVVAVAAETEEIAEKAIELIDIEYEKLEAALDVKEAVKEDAPLVHENLGELESAPVFFPKPGTNIAHHTKIRKGDIEKGFEEADYIIENEFELPMVDHTALETHTSIAKWMPGKKVKIWTSAQSPFAVRNLLANGLHLNHEDIEVQIPYVGGGFGGKAGIHFEPLVTCLSRASQGRPVKIVMSRMEEFNSVPVRQGLYSKLKTGVTKEGKIVAFESEYLWDSGANADYGVNVTRAAATAGAGPYEVDNVKLDSKTVYTNKIFGTAYRGFGHLEILWAVERQMDLVAEEIGMSPYDIRMKNGLKRGSVTITGEHIGESHGKVLECLEAVAEEIDYENRSSDDLPDGKKRGKGLALLHKAPAMPTDTGTAAFLKFNENGTLNLTVSLTDYGQGTYTALAQIVSDQLDIPIDKVNVVWEQNTETQPYDWQTVASKGLFMSGNATIKACQDMAQQLKEVASEPLRCSVEDLIIEDEKVKIRHHKDKYISFKDLAMGYSYPNGNAIGGPLVARGNYIAQGLTNIDPETGQGLPALDWTYGAHGVEVIVDEETGELEVIKIASAFDVGKTINKQNVIGQIEGGVIQGYGSAVMEGYQFSDDGRLLTNTFTDYKVPSIADIPELKPIIIENAQEDGPYGARGVAEHPMLSIPSAVGNAVQDAIGIHIKEMPVIPERIYDYIEKEK